ncbi:hypothetical protein ACIO3O_15645 [Streptomyces sp. NPDC087440]|uniref:hypothetical protein n=1 Tax=Streptomyces sp. NPDC087440 TaxID=3365790 RepID=UPI00382572F8
MTIEAPAPPQPDAYPALSAYLSRAAPQVPAPGPPAPEPVRTPRLTPRALRTGILTGLGAV